MNTQIKRYIKQHNLRQWQVAKHLGISENTFSHWFREEIGKDRETLIIQAVDELAEHSIRSKL